MTDQPRKSIRIMGISDRISGAGLFARYRAFMLEYGKDEALAESLGVLAEMAFVFGIELDVSASQGGDA